MSQLFPWGGQSTGVSTLASFLPKNTQDRSPLEWTGCISLQSKGLSRVFSNTTVQKHQFLQCSAVFTVQLSHPYMTTGKITALTRWTFVGKVMSLLFNMLSRLVITFLPRSKCLVISWLQSPICSVKSNQFSTLIFFSSWNRTSLFLQWRMTFTGPQDEFTSQQLSCVLDLSGWSHSCLQVTTMGKALVKEYSFF